MKSSGSDRKSISDNLTTKVYSEISIKVDTRHAMQHEGVQRAQSRASVEKNRLQINIADAFAILGGCVAKYPRTTLLVNALVTCICFAGVFSPNMVYESKSENLWVPTVIAHIIRFQLSYLPHASRAATF